MNNLIAQMIAFVPLMLAFIGCILAMGSYTQDIWGLALIAIAALLYGPCSYISSIIWRD